MYIAAGLDAAGQQTDEGRLDQAAFVMALFGPGVGKIDVDACQRVRCDHVAGHFHRIVLDDAYIAGPRFVDALERSEEHTSELQSLMRTSYAVFCLKKKKPNN